MLRFIRLTAVVAFLALLMCLAAAQGGKNPRAGLIQGPDGSLYGTTRLGGQYSKGTVFKYSVSTGVLTYLHHFSGLDGAYPHAKLMLARDGYLYGTTSEGGPNYSPYPTPVPHPGHGIVFRVNPASGGSTRIFSFTGANGSNPKNGLIQGPSGDDSVYGVASTGGANSSGSVFRMTLPPTNSGVDSASILWSRSFAATNSSGANSEGANPQSELVYVNGKLYGTCYKGGSTATGSVYRINSDGTSFTVIKNLVQGSTAYYPYSGLMDPGSSSPHLYGMMIDPAGAIYRVNKSTDQYEEIRVFNTTNDTASMYQPIPQIQGQRGLWPAGVPVYSSTDGYFYAVNLTAGHLPGIPYAPLQMHGNVVRFTSGGAMEALAYFRGESGYNHPTNPWGAPIVGQDGYLYGTCDGAGGENTTPSNNGGIWRCSRSGGAVTILVAF